MRVCVLTAAHSPHDVRIFHKQCRSLATAGYRVTLIAPGAECETRDGVEIEGVRRWRRRILRMTLGSLAIWSRAVQARARIYHFHDPELTPVALLLRLMGKRVIYDIHEDIAASIRSRHYLPRGVGRLLGSLIQAWESGVCRWFSALVVATPAIAERVRGRNNVVLVVQNFPLRGEIGAVRSPWASRRNAVVYAGGISLGRGIREMVAAIGLLPRELAPELTLAGDFVPAALLKEAKNWDGWERVDFRGRVERHAMLTIFAEARAGLVLFHPLPNHVNAVPNKLFEYMAAGLPVIASDFPSWGVLIRRLECGIVVDPADIEAISAAIRYIFLHPDEAQAMGQRGQRWVVNKYNWDREAAKLVKLYRALDGSGGMAPLGDLSRIVSDEVQ